MTNILVLYHSQTGNTQKMAEYVAEGAAAVPGCEVRLRSIEEADSADIFWADGIACGSPTHMGVLSWPMKQWWDSRVDALWPKVDGRVACAFSSGGAWGGGQEMACLSLLILLMNFGFLVFGVTDYVAKEFSLHYGAVAALHPDSPEEIAACRKLGERLAEWAAVCRKSRNTDF
jgi:NAD(P)H dehydrogenase (quinone)